MLRPRILLSLGIFFLFAFFGFALVDVYPELAGLFASPAMIADVQRGHLWMQSLFSVVPPALASLAIFSNNLVVTLMAFLFGTLYGIGTLYMLGFNGMMLGALLAFTGRYGLATALVTFVVAHGFVEISVICIAGACGMSLGDALIHPGADSRLEALQRAALICAPVLLVAAVFLVGAGVIEGFVSPRQSLPFAVHLAVGLAYGLVFLAVLTGRAFRRSGGSDAGRPPRIKRDAAGGARRTAAAAPDPDAEANR